MEQHMSQDDVNEVAMNMILHAGNGRNLIKKALDEMAEGAISQGRETLLKAKESLNLAHRAQTDVVQYNMIHPVTINLLFTHAQDTLMTILSEYNMAQYFAKLFIKVAKYE